MFGLIQESDLWITQHAAEKMVIEGISARQVCEAIEKGSKFQQTDGFLAVHSYFSVAYKRVGSLYKIKTVFIN